MKGFSDSLLLLLLWMLSGAGAQSSSYYGRTFYNPHAAQPTHYYHRNEHGFLPQGYGGDLLTEESKQKELSKKYAKKIPFRPYGSEEEDFSNERYTSGEYSSESHGYNSKESDSREYTIGTQIRVQHPITVPKKTTSHPKHILKYTTIGNPYKGSSYSDTSLSAEAHDYKPTPKKHAHKYTQLYEPDPFHVVPPPKPTATLVAPSSHIGYNVYENDQEDYEEPHSSRAAANLRERFKGVASKKQIEKYLDDQQKLLDEALKLRFLSNPKFQQYLKSKQLEQFEEGEYDHDLPRDAPPPVPLPSYRPNFDDNLTYKTSRPRRRPQAAELKRSPKSKHSSGSKPKRKYRSAFVINV